MAPRPEQGPPPVHPAGNGNRADPGTGRRRALLTMTERDLSTVRQQVSQAGTAAGAVVLCDMAEQNAAQVLAGYPAETAGALIEAIAARRLATAGAILRMLSAAKAGAAVGYLAPVTAAAILGAMPVRQAVRILSCTNARRAGGVIESLQPGIAIQVIAALPESQAARVLGFVGPPRVAVLIRALGGPGNALLARLDADYRAQVLRYLSR